MIGDMIYLIAGYAVFFIITLIYVYSLVSRQKNLKKEMDSLKLLQQHEGGRE